MKRIMFILSALLMAYGQQANATGTAAGTVISNQASASFTVSGANNNVTSNTLQHTVDELINVTVTWADGGNVSTATPGTDKILKFQVTNTGNGSEQFNLANVTAAIGGDNFDPTTDKIFYDHPTNGTAGTYDVGVDVEYTGANGPTLAANANTFVYVQNDIAAGLSNGDTGNSRLTATSVTDASGTAGNVTAGAGDSGTDAVLGTTGGTANTLGTFVVTTANVTLTKTATVSNTLGGTDPIPGATITYTVTASVTGSGSADTLQIVDATPTNTTFVAGSIKVTAPGINGGAQKALTDASDGDEGDHNVTNGGSVTVNAGTVAAGSSAVIEFQVTID